jgi:predicted DNA-binding antitoxin AbrB/MazE fold protein
MAKHIDVIYTNGVFRPSKPLEVEFEEGQRLTLVLPEAGAQQEPFVEDEETRKWCAEQAGSSADAVQNSRINGGRGDYRTR